MSNLLKSNFPTKEVHADEEKVDPHEAYLKKAKESIAGSMVFTERKLRYWDGRDEVPGTPESDSADRA